MACAGVRFNSKLNRMMALSAIRPVDIKFSLSE
jgi:hypothetical protein